MTIDPNALWGALGGLTTGAVGLWVALRQAKREDRQLAASTHQADSSSRQSERDQLLSILEKLQSSQAAWFTERAALHDENISMKTEVAQLRMQCEQLKTAVEDLKEHLSEFNQVDHYFWREHFVRAPIPVLRVGSKGEILDANEEFESVFGYPESKITELTFIHITHPEDVAVDLKMVEECLAGTRETYSMRKRYKKNLSDEWIIFDLHVITTRKFGEFKYFTSYLMPVND